MELRTELTEAQKEVEPQNADSHLAFIGAGLRNCVTYRRRPDAPVYFVDLDGVNKGARRASARRRSLGLRRGAQSSASALGDPGVEAPDRLGQPGRPAARALIEQIERAGREPASKAAASTSRSSPCERHVGLTVNEYETLLMQHDLVDVLRNPLRFAQMKAQHMLDDPRAIPGKTLNYAKYNVVRVMNPLMEAFGLDQVVARAAGRRR